MWLQISSNVYDGVKDFEDHIYMIYDIYIYIYMILAGFENYDLIFKFSKKKKKWKVFISTLLPNKVKWIREIGANWLWTEWLTARLECW